MPSKRLFRSRENAMIGGVCAGIADYFNTDPSLIRLATVLLFFAGGVGVLGYIVAWIIIPHKPLNVSSAEAAMPAEPSEEKANPKEATEEVNRPRFILGIVLVLLGCLFLMGSLSLWHWFSFFRLWPIILIVIGIMIITKGVNKGESHES
jgi:phage shock protein C